MYIILALIVLCCFIGHHFGKRDFYNMLDDAAKNHKQIRLSDGNWYYVEEQKNKEGDKK